MSHIYRVKLESVEALVKADSKAAARAVLTKKITIERLDTGELFEAMKRGELVIEASEEQPELPGLAEPEGGEGGES
jgi:hypothetical protein